MHFPRLTTFVLFSCLFSLLANRAAGQWAQQQIVLKPGWNAVFLEVDPSPADCDALFAGLPVESVWDWNRGSETAQFVQNADTLLPGTAGWLTWFPPNHSLSGQGSLFALRDGRPYLVKSTNATAFTWTITGKPSLRRPSWRSGTVNLAGFHVGAPAPTFQSLFLGHIGLTNQPVYALDAAGVWRAVLDPNTARPRAGEAYWVRCRYPSQAAGTILVEGISRNGLAFTPTASEQSLRIRNASAGNRQVSVRLLASAPPPSGETPSAGPVPLAYWKADFAATNFAWQPLSVPLTFGALTPGQEWNVRLAVPGGAMSAVPAGATLQSLLEITDDLGMRWLVPISAGRPEPGVAGAGPGFQAASAGSAQAGLWVGEAVLNAVSQPAHPEDGGLPRPAGGSFSFRILVHVDGGGTARLLQQVFLVRKPPVLAPDPNDPFLSRVVESARTVAVTDESLIPGLIGAAELTGRRISSPAFPFSQPVVLNGGFGTGTLQAGFTLDYDHPLNPFKHVFHPDHNNLDERYEQKLPEGRESFTVTRAVALEFTAADPLGLNPPGWGATEVGGHYRESITGLHRHVLHVAGTFRLVRVLNAPALNQ